MKMNELETNWLLVGIVIKQLDLKNFEKLNDFLIEFKKKGKNIISIFL